MMLSDLDGFLTAFPIRPELVVTSQWLPVTNCEEGAGLIFPILALFGDENGESLLGPSSRRTKAALRPM
jgi:hypothetical protein